MRHALIAFVLCLAACGPQPSQPDTATQAQTPDAAPDAAATTDSQRTDAMQDVQEIKCTEAEKNALSSIMAGVPGFDANVAPWKQVGTDFYLIAEAIPPGAVELLVKHALTHP